MLAWRVFFLSVHDVRRTKRNGGGADPTRTNPRNQCKTGFQKFAGKIKKSEICRCWLPFFLQLRQMRSRLFFSERAHARRPREVGEKTRAVFLCTGGRVEAAFLLSAAEFPCWKSPAGHAAPFHRCRRSLLFHGSGRATAGPPLVSEPGQQKHQVRPGRRFQVIHNFFPPILDKRSFFLLSPPFHHLSGGILFEHGGCDEPGDEPPTPGVFPNAGRNHRRTGDTGSEAGTRNGEIRPQGAAEETESGGVDYRPADGPLRLRGKDTLTITGLRNPIESIDQAAPPLSNWLRGSS